MLDVAKSVSDGDVLHFQEKGFLIHDHPIFLSSSTMFEDLHKALECVINKDYDTGVPPANCSKIPQTFYVDGRFSFSIARKWSASPGNRTIHLVNIWQASSIFRNLVTSPTLGQAVVKLMKWEDYGCRVAQDQVWIKPPHSGPLSFHRDTPYIDFSPKEVCTVWIPFDRVSKECGTLEYCSESHKWSEGRRGSANQFYNPDYRHLLELAAASEAEGSNPETLHSCETKEIQYALVGEGGCSFHNGNTWHGSASNCTDGWRRGIGIHFVRGDALLAEDAGRLWRTLQNSPSQVPRDDVFPRVV